MVATTLLWACGTARAPAVAPAVANQGGSRIDVCEWPTHLELAARRYDNVDQDDPAYQRWSPWTISIRTMAAGRELRGVAEMSGERMHWKINVAGKLDCLRGMAELRFETHEPMTLSLLVPTRQGRITSIDDVWIVGAPFPKYRP